MERCVRLLSRLVVGGDTPTALHARRPPTSSQTVLKAKRRSAHGATSVWYLLRDSPHRRSLAKCWWASSKGNGRPTKVTARWSWGNVSCLWSTGLRVSCQKECAAGGKVDERFAAPRDVDASQAADTSVRVDKVAALYAQVSARACGRPVVCVGRARAGGIVLLARRMHG